MEKKVNVPKKGAGRKWAECLKKIGERSPPEGLMEILNQTEKPKSEKPKKVATPYGPQNDLDV